MSDDFEELKKDPLVMELARIITKAMDIKTPFNAGVYPLFLSLLETAVKDVTATEDIIDDFIEEVNDVDSLVSWVKCDMFSYAINGGGLLHYADYLSERLIVGKVVYLIENPKLSIYKIGLTNNINRRLKELSYACGIQLNLLATYVPNCTVDEMEAMLHSHFSDRRLLGEWFNEVDKQTFLEICNRLDKSQTRLGEN